MKGIEVSFTHEGKTYAGTIGYVFGMGEHSWHLYINGFYCGILTRPNGQWIFSPSGKDPWLKDYAEYFGNMVEGAKREPELWEE
jgi:hypothetical protein